MGRAALICATLRSLGVKSVFATHQINAVLNSERSNVHASFDKIIIQQMPTVHHLTNNVSVQKVVL